MSFSIESVENNAKPVATPAQSKASPRARFRLRFALATLVLGCIAIGAIILLIMTQHDLTIARAEIQRLKGKMGLPAIKDPAHAYVVASAAVGDCSWRWHIYLPKDKTYTFHFTGHNIPEQGIPIEKPEAGWTPSAFVRGDGMFTVDVIISRTTQGNWQALYSVPLQGMGYEAARWDSTTMNSPTLSNPFTPCSWKQTGTEGNEEFSSGHPIELLRLRQDKKLPNGRYVVDRDPCAGLLIWIEETK